MQAPSWALNSCQLKFNNKHNIRDPHTATKDPPSTTNNTNLNNKNMYVVVPYIRGLSEKFMTTCNKVGNTCNKVGIKVHFKGNNTVQNLLMALKNKTTCVREMELSTITNVHTWTVLNNR